MLEGRNNARIPSGVQFKFVQHKVLKPRELLEICKIKQLSWPHSIDDQISWINNNIKDQDLHICMFVDDIFMGYANLVCRNIKINDDSRAVLGLGNVCVKKKKNRLGTLLMERVNRYILETNNIGVLLCKSFLIDFYLSVGWATAANACGLLSEDIWCFIYPPRHAILDIDILQQSF